MRTEIEALKEIRDRLTYFCARLDGKYDPPWAQEVIGIIDDVLITPYRQCKRFGAPFYVEVGTSIVAIRCASNHDVVWRADHSVHGKSTVDWAESVCTRMNKEVETRNSGDTAKLREALKYLRDASREFCHLILNSKYNEVFDKYKYAEVAKVRDAIANANVALAAPATTKKSSAVGDAAKLREVVERVVNALSGKMADAPAAMTSHEVAILKQCRAALAAPPRNCDVGTVEEQEVRFDGFCMAHKEIKEPGLKGCSDDCPFVMKGFCDLHWAQMPYEEGGNK